MVRIPSSPPNIAPRLNNKNVPLWSVMIPVYNCSRYLPDALKSVLINDITEEEMQIEVIDDASTDADVEAIVEQIGKGRIKYFRQMENVGSLLNFETCINRSRGNLVHILHGDDRVKKGYYEKIANLFQEYPEAGAAFCRFGYIDGKGKWLYNQPGEMNYEGILPEWIVRIGEHCRIQYVAITVRREVYEKLGSFYGLTYGEDWEMWARIASNYQTVYSPEILAEYRKHSDSITGKKFLTGEYLLDLAHAMKLIQVHLPLEQKKSILKKAKKFYAYYGLRKANDLWHISRDKLNVKTSISQALKLHQDFFMYWEIAKLYTKMILRKLIKFA
jgi:glycosyltransferase involved in cell wall biosynthesis